jgi:phosphoserine aminotransferase
MARIHNFNPGPATLPESVLEKAREIMWELPGAGTGAMEISHRSAEFDEHYDVMHKRIRRLFQLDDDVHVLFCQGGARTQFAMLPMNFLQGSAAYVDTGTWSDKAIDEAALFGDARVVASSKSDKYNYIPTWSADWLKGDESYFHITSNNTIYGTQWHQWPDTGDVPLVVDMSSDIGSRVVDMSQFDMVYAGAQKNLGPAGVTLVFIKDSFAKKAQDSHLPQMFRYKTFIDSNSLYNTPPVWNILMVGLVLEWIEESGGVAGIEANNQKKADLLYGLLESHDGFYTPSAEQASRSLMNITFNLPTVEMEKQLVADAREAGYLGIKGHRVLGGIRVSNYNAVSLESMEKLVAFLKEYAAKHG